MAKIHIYNKIEGTHYCKNNSSYVKPEMAKMLSEATCKVCIGLYKIDRGNAEKMPFGGDLDSEGNLRKKLGRGERRG